MPDRFQPSSSAAEMLDVELRVHGSSDRASAHLDWAASGAMWLTGRSDGPPLIAPAAFATRARYIVAALARSARAAGLDRDGELARLDGAALLGERAAIAGFTRRGTTSPGGSCHLLACADGWIALNLARADDVALLPAWLAGGDDGDEGVADQLDADAVAGRVALVAQTVRTRRVRELVERARMLGLPCAESADAPADSTQWCRTLSCGTPAPSGVRYDTGTAARAAARRQSRPGHARPLVVDLSSLWAGPLASHLLAAAGMDVVKVESTRRPDGARYGPAAFYDLLNAHKRSVAVDFMTHDGRRVLRELLARADIVIEASRPRALTQLGIDAHAVVCSRPGVVWVSITGYGRRTPEDEWVAFGDDAAAAAGVTAAMAAYAGTPVFCGDAIADPLTGMHAAHAALSAWAAGAGVLLDLSLRDVTAHVLASAPLAEAASVVRAGDSGETHWELRVGGERCRVERPHARSVARRARELGADTTDVLAELAISC